MNCVICPERYTATLVLIRLRGLNCSGNHGATEIGAIGQGLTQKRYELGAVVSRKGIGIDRLLVFAGAAAAGQCAGSQQQDDTCTPAR